MHSIHSLLHPNLSPPAPSSSLFFSQWQSPWCPWWGPGGWRWTLSCSERWAVPRLSSSSQPSSSATRPSRGWTSLFSFSSCRISVRSHSCVSLKYFKVMTNWNRNCHRQATRHIICNLTHGRLNYLSCLGVWVAQEAAMTLSSPCWVTLRSEVR